MNGLVEALFQFCLIHFRVWLQYLSISTHIEVNRTRTHLAKSWLKLLLQHLLPVISDLSDFLTKLKFRVQQINLHTTSAPSALPSCATCFQNLGFWSGTASVSVLAGTDECFLLYFLLGWVIPHFPSLQIMEDESRSATTTVLSLPQRKYWVIYRMLISTELSVFVIQPTAKRRI